MEVFLVYRSGWGTTRKVILIHVETASVELYFYWYAMKRCSTNHRCFSEMCIWNSCIRDPRTTQLGQLCYTSVHPQGFPSSHLPGIA